MGRERRERGERRTGGGEGRGEGARKDINRNPVHRRDKIGRRGETRETRSEKLVRKKGRERGTEWGGKVNRERKENK